MQSVFLFYLLYLALCPRLLLIETLQHKNDCLHQMGERGLLQFCSGELFSPPDRDLLNAGGKKVEVFSRV